MTNENAEYGPGWRRCIRCNLVDPQVRLVPHLPAGAEPAYACDDVERCRRHLNGQPLGGPRLEVGQLVRFELDANERLAVEDAVAAWRERKR